jgi:hypothetical protein
MTLDHYLDGFGEDLARAGRTRRRRRRRARVALALPAAAALAVAVAVLPSANGVNALAEAREALAPTNEIVHMKVQTKVGKAGYGPTTEQWYGGDPARWRMVQGLVPARPPRARPGTPTPGALPEMIYSNDRMRLYDKRRDVVTILSNLRLLKPMGPSVLGGDPSTDLRAMLAKGDVRDDGVVTVDGRQVRRLVSERNDAGPLRRLVYYMDPQTFAPLGGRMYFGDRRRPAFVFEVTEYERLPLNEETEQLLKFDKTPDTKYVWRDLKRPRRG